MVFEILHWAHSFNSSLNLTHTNRKSSMSGVLEVVLSSIHKVLVTGALSKGWGGPACRAALDIRTHIIESAFWLLIGAVSYHFYDVKRKFQVLCKNIQLDLSKSSPSPLARKFELCLATVHIAMFLQIVYYKINILSLVNMIQPCHVILLLQGIALYSTGTTGVIISLCVLPSLTGTLLAMLFPDTGGLDQPFEMEAYWLQHYLVQVVPIYLLVRRDYIALKNFSYFPVFLGLWVLLLAHFSLFEVVDLALNVNVEFMLCPTSAMLTIFPLVPSWVLWPSYRSTLTHVVIIVGSLISYTYVGAASLIRMALPSRSLASSAASAVKKRS